MKAVDLESLNSRKRDKRANDVAIRPKQTRNHASALRRVIYPSGGGKLNPNLDAQEYAIKTNIIRTMMNAYFLDRSSIKLKMI